MNELLKNQSNENGVDCFGCFNLANTVCRKHCALRLRCVIEQTEQSRLESLDDLISYSEVNLKMQ